MKLRPDGLTEEVPASFASPSQEPEEPVGGAGGAGVAPQLLTLINSAIVCSLAGGRGATLQLSDVVFLERRDSTLPKLRAPWQRVGWLCCIRLYLQHGLSSGAVRGLLSRLLSAVSCARNANLNWQMSVAKADSWLREFQMFPK